MADLVSYGNADRDIEQALIALKKGAQLLKYGRKGKPKFYPFRLSSDETSLLWISSSGERSLKLSSVLRLIPGQRTAVFQRYLRPDKEYLSFSLIYNNGKRSLDLICKDRVEAEIWIGGLKTLISSGQGGRSKIDGWNDGGLCFDDNRDLTSNSPSNSSASAARDLGSPEASSVFSSITSSASPRSYHHHGGNLIIPPSDTSRSHASLDQTSNTTMHVKAASNSDALRVSVSSAPSTSSHGSQPDDCDALGDVYIWGEVICENGPPEKNLTSPITTRTDVLVPKPLECNFVLDVHHVACGVRHAALVTRRGEVFSWGEESGGRLGHGIGKDIVQPHLVESLTSCSVDFAACGEFHSCAVTMSGELYTWGDGTHHAGLLGHGTDISHWIPKRVSGPLDGLQVASISCGPWHTALVTSGGQLFTFGDGTFGVLGHGDRASVSYPREVGSLSGLRTVAVACGVWHTAAVVEVIVAQSGSSSGKLFTWGDGDKNRLGHGDRDPRLEPTCVPALIDYDFHKIACGHSLTVGLTTSGRVFTMGSTVYGQLGNPKSDGKLPCLVEDRLATESVEEIACGAYHVTVLTSKNEVYTWGKGANGRLGHGDVEDKKTPTLVESLKDRHVKFIACGSNYTAAICLHKWVSGAEQSQCSACRQAFGFTRKRHNCYNCGLVHCHSCTSRKALRAALAPNPGKPYRVCEICYAKLSKVSESSGISNNRRSSTGPRLSGENKDKLDKSDLKLARSAMSANYDMIRQLDSKAAKQGKKSEGFSLARSSQSLSQIKDAVRTVPRPILTPSSVSSRSVSPFSRRSSPPRSATPVPTTSGLSFSKSIADGLKKTNEILNQEVHKLRMQVESLKNRCDLQELEIQRSAKKAQEAMALASEESMKCKAAKEVIKSLTAQVKDMAERLPPGAYDPESLKLVYMPNGLEPNVTTHDGSNGQSFSKSETINNSSYTASSHLQTESSNASDLLQEPTDSLVVSNQRSISAHKNGHDTTNRSDTKQLHDGLGSASLQSYRSSLSESVEGGENSLKSKISSPIPGGSGQIESEWSEQYEPGVYITLIALRDGTRDLKRVRFSRRRFGEHQAETWWSENREKVYEKYNVRGSDKSTTASMPSARRSEGPFSPSSQV